MKTMVKWRIDRFSVDCFFDMVLIPFLHSSLQSSLTAPELEVKSLPCWTSTGSSCSFERDALPIHVLNYSSVNDCPTFISMSIS